MKSGPSLPSRAACGADVSSAAGALSTASGSVCCVDELDEFSESDLSTLLTALESGEVRINKVVESTLPADTTFIGAANPKHGRYDPHEPIDDQFDFPPALLSRMDIVMVTRNEASSSDDRAKGAAIANRFTSQESGEGNAPVNKEEMRKLVHWMRERDVTLSDDVVDYAADWWATVRSELGGDIPEWLDERQYQAVLRLAISSARIRGRSEAREDDIDRAEDMVLGWLDDLATDMDASTLYSGVTDSQHDRRETLKTTVRDLSEASDDYIGAYEDAVIESMPPEFGRSTLEKDISSMLNSGELERWGDDRLEVGV